MKQRIVLLGGGIDSIGIVGRALQMGLETVVIDQDQKAPARNLAHYFLPVSCYDIDQVLDALNIFGRHPDGVLCAGTDAPHVMAAVASAYDLIGPSAETAFVSRNKLEQARLLSQNDVKVPSFGGHRFDDFTIDGPPPWVLKPADSRGARAVFRVTDIDQPWKEWFKVAQLESATRQVILQRWVDGQQISSESLVQGGRILWTAFADRNYDRLEEFAPYVIEDGCDMPSAIIPNHENDWRQKADSELQKCIGVLGLVNGVLKGDLVWDGQRIWVIEVATRLSGGRMCSDITPEVWGVDFVGMAIRIALGDHIWPGEINPYLRRHCTQRFQFPVRPTAHPDRGPHVIGYGTTRSEAQRNAAKQLQLLEASMVLKEMQEPVS